MKGWRAKEHLAKASMNSSQNAESKQFDVAPPDFHHTVHNQHTLTPLFQDIVGNIFFVGVQTVVQSQLLIGGQRL